MNRALTGRSLLIMGALTGALVAGSQGVARPPQGDYGGALVIWLASLVMVTVAWWPRSPWAQWRTLGLWIREHSGEFVLLTAIVAFAAAIRLWQLDQVLNVMLWDEGEVGLLGQAIRHHRIINPFASNYWQDWTNLYFYPVALAMDIFGEGLLAIRITSALVGTLAVFFTYLLAREFFDRWVALVAALFLAVYHPHLHYSRATVTPLGNTDGSFFVAAALYFFASGLHQRSPLRLALAGLIIGLSWYSYLGSRLAIGVVLVYIAVLLIRDRRTVAENLGNLGALIIAVMVAVLPIGLWFWYHPQTMATRWEAENVIKHLQDPDWKAAPDFLQEFWRRQVWPSLAYFHTVRDTASWYAPGRPPLDVLSAALFWVGAGWGFIRMALLDKRWASLWAWFAATLVGGSVLIYNPPGSHRLVGASPFIAICLAISVMGVGRLPARLIPGRGGSGLGMAGVLAFSIWFTLSNVGFYFTDYVVKKPVAEGWEYTATLAGRYMQSLGQSYRFYFYVTPDRRVAEKRQIRFYTFGLAFTELIPGERPDAVPLDPRQGTVFLFLPERLADLQGIKGAYPGGVEHTITYAPGKTAFIAYVVGGPPLTDRPGTQTPPTPLPLFVGVVMLAAVGLALLTVAGPHALSYLKVIGAGPIVSLRSLGVAIGNALDEGFPPPREVVPPGGGEGGGGSAPAEALGVAEEAAPPVAVPPQPLIEETVIMVGQPEVEEGGDRPFWVVLGGIAIFGVWFTLSRRSENILWLLLSAICFATLAYRFYGAFLASRLNLMGRPAIVGERAPTARWILLGYQVASTAGVGLLIGPVLAIQFGFLPGYLWILVGAVVAGAVHDLVVLVASTRQGGAFLPDMIAGRWGPWAGICAWGITLMGIVVFIGAVGPLLVEILSTHGWAAAAAAGSGIIALAVALYGKRWQRGHPGEAIVLGTVLLILVVALGSRLGDASVPIPRLAVAMLVAGYAAAASVTPMDWLSRPRVATSGWFLIGTVAIMILLTMVAAPSLRIPPISRWLQGGPVVPGGVLPYLALVVTGGVLSGFNALMASGVTSRMLEQETDAPTVGYGSVLVQMVMAIFALLVAATLYAGDFYAITTTIQPADVPKVVGEQPREWERYGGLVQASIAGHPDGVTTLAVAFAKDMHGIPPMPPSWLPLFYRLIFVLQALALLATLETMGRVARLGIERLLALFPSYSVGGSSLPLDSKRMRGQQGLSITTPVVGGCVGVVVWLLSGSFLGSALLPLYGMTGLALAAVGLAAGLSLAPSSRRDLRVAIAIPLTLVLLLTALGMGAVARDGLAMTADKAAAQKAWGDLTLLAERTGITPRERALAIQRELPATQVADVLVVRGEAELARLLSRRFGDQAPNEGRVLASLVARRTQALVMGGWLQAILTLAVGALLIGTFMGRFVKIPVPGRPNPGAGLGQTPDMVPPQRPSQPADRQGTGPEGSSQRGQ